MTITRHARTLAGVLGLCAAVAACGPKDADIQSAANAAIAATPGMTVSVTDGVATISGQAADESARAAAESAVKAVKGVKSVSINATVAPPPAPVVISADDSLKANVNAALKDYPTIVARVQGGVVTLTGTIAKADLPKVMQALSPLHPKKIENRATVK